MFPVLTAAESGGLLPIVADESRPPPDPASEIPKTTHRAGVTHVRNTSQGEYPNTKPEERLAGGGSCSPYNEGLHEWRRPDKYQPMYLMQLVQLACSKHIGESMIGAVKD